MCRDFGKYINPFTDFGFKKLFGEENSKPQLISFLNAFLELEKKDKIVEVEFKNLEKLILNIDRKAIFDIYYFDKNENPAILLTLTFIFIEMPKFNKKEHELVTYLDKWFYFLKKLDTLESIPLIFKEEKVMVDAFKKAEYLNLQEEDKDKYFYSLKAYRDLHNVIETAGNEAYEKGMERGLQDGIEKGLEKGKIEIAKNLLDILDNETIAKKTGLTLKQVEELR